MICHIFVVGSIILSKPYRFLSLLLRSGHVKSIQSVIGVYEQRCTTFRPAEISSGPDFLCQQGLGVYIWHWYEVKFGKK